MSASAVQSNSRNILVESTEESSQYVTFLVAGETYGVSVHKVQSINEMLDITHVPHSNFYIEGVINLRGTVIPVVSIRKKYNLPYKEYDLFTVIIIVEVKDRLVGMIVDSVSDVVSIPVSDIQIDINYSVKIDTSSIEGIGKVKDQLIILLNVEHFLDDDKETDI
ncbi:MAG TPA: chemotaxis protein CheW [Spirochaetota bacterium]|nr:chemotaxis protein CheW [Spirochaetota bacterium]